MSIFKNIFESNTELESKNSKLNWIQITDINQLQTIADESNSRPCLIFKHSTTCSISRMALKNFEAQFSLESKISIYFLDLLNYRTISNEIATFFNVLHQSPQILLIENGRCVYNASHENIDALILESKI
jgi:bacillithiol system protein YtxJ